MIPAIILGIFALLFIWLEMPSTIRAEKVKSEWEAGSNSAKGVLIVMRGIGCAVASLAVMPKTTSKPKIGESDGDKAAFQKGATEGKEVSASESLSMATEAPLPLVLVKSSDKSTAMTGAVPPEAEKRKYCE